MTFYVFQTNFEQSFWIRIMHTVMWYIVIHSVLGLKAFCYFSNKLRVIYQSFPQVNTLRVFREASQTCTYYKSNVINTKNFNFTNIGLFLSIYTNMYHIIHLRINHCPCALCERANPEKKTSRNRSYYYIFFIKYFNFINFSKLQ